MKVVVAGGTGFIGTPLVRALVAERHSVVVLTRHNRSISREPLVVYQEWDATTIGSWAKSLEGADAIINLVGEPLDQKRWSQSQKRVLNASRISATRALLMAVADAARKPEVLINASAVGYYGIAPPGVVTESSSAGRDFLAELCAQWEYAALQADHLGLRLVIPRMAVVLSSGGGALKKMLLPYRFFVGGPIGSGDQWFPWVHRDDLIDILLLALSDPQISGPINVVAPEAVTMRDFCRTLGKVLHRPCWLPVPGAVLRLAVGEIAETLLGGQHVIPEKLISYGYSFRYPTVERALRAILQRVEGSR